MGETILRDTAYVLAALKGSTRATDYAERHPTDCPTFGDAIRLHYLMFQAAEHVDPAGKLGDNAGMPRLAGENLPDWHGIPRSSGEGVKAEIGRLDNETRLLTTSKHFTAIDKAAFVNARMMAISPFHGGNAQVAWLMSAEMLIAEGVTKSVPPAPDKAAYATALYRAVIHDDVSAMSALLNTATGSQTESPTHEVRFPFRIQAKNPAVGSLREVEINGMASAPAAVDIMPGAPVPVSRSVGVVAPYREV